MWFILRFSYGEIAKHFQFTISLCSVISKVLSNSTQTVCSRAELKWHGLHSNNTTENWSAGSRLTEVALLEAGLPPTAHHHLVIQRRTFHLRPQLSPSSMHFTIFSAVFRPCVLLQCVHKCFLRLRLGCLQEREREGWRRWLGWLLSIMPYTRESIHLTKR